MLKKPSILRCLEPSDAIRLQSGIDRWSGAAVIIISPVILHVGTVTREHQIPRNRALARATASRAIADHVSADTDAGSAAVAVATECRAAS